MGNQNIAVVWFRQDLRLADNPALHEAVKNGSVLPIYIFDTVNGDPAPTGASLVWLYHSLQSLNDSLDGHLHFYVGDPIEILKSIVSSHSVASINWNRCYSPWQIKRDKLIKQYFPSQGVLVNSFQANLLWEPWQVTSSGEKAYRVFTPFYRKGCLSLPDPRMPLARLREIPLVKLPIGSSVAKCQHLTWLLTHRRWETDLMRHWKVGEEAAQTRLQQFIHQQLDNYKSARNFPAKQKVSRLSPHLRFGEISPHQVWAKINASHKDVNTQHFCQEIAWREFSYYLLYHFPEIGRQNLYPQFDKFPWQANDVYLSAWQQGKTGYPIIDAGMRELYQTGYMHNRLRMCVGSFLTKNLLIDWREGEAWFWRCLLDADAATNPASWQWVAGSGTDTKEYCRIFNPVTQGKKFDPDGDYIRKFVPELGNLKNDEIFSPWSVPADILHAAGVKLGQDYPFPIVDYSSTAQVASRAFSDLIYTSK